MTWSASVWSTSLGHPPSTWSTLFVAVVAVAVFTCGRRERG